MGGFEVTHVLELDRAPQRRAAKRDLEKLWVAFVKLQRLRKETMVDFGLHDTTEVDDVATVELSDAILTPIAAELRRLAYRASKVEAKCDNDLEYKAVMLAEFLPAEGCAIQTVLARSLIQDIKKSG